MFRVLVGVWTVFGGALALAAAACGHAGQPAPAPPGAGPLVPPVSSATAVVDVAPPEESAAPEPAKKPATTDPIKVGIVYSLSGTMAVTETSLKDVALMTIEQLNLAGGVLGRKIEPVVVDPASNWPLFAEKARELLQRDGVAAVFGCYTSVSRKSVIPVFEELNGLLFYPAQYEGQESSKNVFYLGAAPNQQAIPAVDYLMSKEGGQKKRWVLIGTDYVYPRTTNRILRHYLTQHQVNEATDVMEKYTPFGHLDYATIVAEIKRFAAGKPTAVISTMVLDSNEPFYRELGKQGLKPARLPVVALSIGEEELRGIDTKPFVGQLAAWNYFMSIETPENKRFVEKWKAYTIQNQLPDVGARVTNDAMEATYLGIKLWASAVQAAGTTDAEPVREAMARQSVKSPSGFELKVNASTQHLDKPAFIGEIQKNGQFKVVWKTDPIRALPYNPLLPENQGRAAP